LKAPIARPSHNHDERANHKGAAGPKGKGPHHGAKRHIRRSGEIDAAADHHEAHSNREHRERRRLHQHVGDVADREEMRRELE
jgi:hypothetical protein